MRCIMLFVLLVVGLMASALAHNVVSGVYADGLLIEGEIGFSNGDMAPAGLVVEVFDKTGNALGKTETKAEGMFLFEASSAQKHVFKVDLGAGHIAEMVLDANELSEAGMSHVESVESVTTSASTTKQSSQGSNVSGGTIGSISTEQLQSLIRSAVAQQVRPLQKEIRAYKEKVFFRDITGGLGFIFGLFGVAAWMASRRKETTP